MQAYRMKVAATFVLVLTSCAGCGGLIGQFDGLPVVLVPDETPWPQLVDTPTPPEARLTAGTGDAALVRLEADRTTAIQRKQKAEQANSVSDTLGDRAVAALSRAQVPVAVVNDDALIAKATLSRQKAATPLESTGGSLLRAGTGRGGAKALDAPVVSAGFDEKARLALERAARAGIP